MSWHPTVGAFPVILAVVLTAYFVLDAAETPGQLAVYVSLVWTAPILVTGRGLVGALRVHWRSVGRTESAPESTHVDLVVVVPTVGRVNTYPALARSVASFHTELLGRFRSMRIDVVVDEGCEMLQQITHLSRRYPSVRTVVVPTNYQTRHGTRFKARANHYAHERRIADGEARDDVWVLHMDDDTAVGAETADVLARFARTEGAARRKHLAQGVLTFPREYATNRFTWLADAVRPGCDVSLFALATGRGCPTAGLHGELLFVRASVEAEIGWDYGPDSTVEDAEFALRFATSYPGASAWIPCRSYGASPGSVGDFVRQRQRWFAGLLRLSTRESIPPRQRSLIIHNVCVWSLAPFAYPGLLMLVALALGLQRVSPVSPLLIPLWAANVAFGVWLYWEGLRINRASSSSRGSAVERFVVVGLIPAFVFLECLAVLRALVEVGLSRPAGFHVISKPR